MKHASNNNPALRPLAQAMRKNMTKEERKLWFQFFKLLPVTVNRQKVISHYIVDFYCATGKLIIELDGGQHYESAGKLYDARRDSELRQLGYTVLRYSNLDIKENFDGVCTDILRHIPIPPPKVSAAASP